MEAIKVENINKGFGSGDNHITVLDGVSLEIRHGKFVSLMGASGSGKSTLLYLIGGLDKADGGSIYLSGKDISSLKDKKFSEIRREKIGFVFQFYNVVQNLTVEENIVLPLLMSGKREKDKLLELYNILNNTDYSNPEDLEVTTLEDVIYMKMKNDISFIIDYRLSLYEHQSTLNPNMPLRGYLYFGKHFQKYIEEKHLNIYGTKLIMLPTPMFVVFYNGGEMEENRKVLKLSDSFMAGKEGGYMELEVMVLNINYGKNKELMEKCKTLWEYAVYVDKVKKYSQTMKIEYAIDRATNECIKENVLAGFLSVHHAEVKDMLLTEYDEEKNISLFQMEIEMERVEKEKIKREKEKAEAEIERLKKELAKYNR